MVCSTFGSFQDSMDTSIQLPGAASQSTVASPGSPYSALDVELNGFQDLYQEPLQALSSPVQVPTASMTSPTRCLSPVVAIRESRSVSRRSRGVSNGLFSRSFLQEVKRDEHKVSTTSPARLQLALPSQPLLAVVNILLGSLIHRFFSERAFNAPAVCVR